MRKDKRVDRTSEHLNADTALKRKCGGLHTILEGQNFEHLFMKMS